MLAALLLASTAGPPPEAAGPSFAIVASCICPPPPSVAAASCECPDGATLGEAFAAQELAHMLGNISNGSQPLLILNATATLPAATRRIAVGYSASVALGVRAADLDHLGLEGSRLSVPGPHNTLPPGCLAVSGGQGAVRGALYGVYELLGLLGLEFMAWDHTVFPPGSPHADLPSLLARLPAADLVTQPSFMYRDLGEWPVYSNRLHSRRMRLS